MKAKKHILWVAGISILLFAQSCISVQSMRYKRGLNIQLSRIKDEKPASLKYTKSAVRHNQNIQRMMPCAPESTNALACLEANAIEGSMRSVLNPDVLPGQTEHTGLNVQPFSVKHLVNQKAPSVRMRSLVAEHTPSQTNTLDFDAGTDDPAPAEDGSPFSILIRALAGTFFGSAAAALLIFSIVLGPILYIIAVFLAFLLSYFGMQVIKQGWQMARERSLGLKLLYILLSIPGFIICGTIYLITYLVAESAGIDLDD